MLLSLQFRLYFETGVFGSTFLGRLRSGFSSSQTLLLSLSSRAFFVTVMFSLTCYWHFQFRLELKLAFSSLPCRTSSLVFLHFSDLLRHFCHGRGCHWHVSLTVHVTGTVTSVTILETGVFRLYLFLGRLRLCFSSSQTFLRLFSSRSFFCHWHVS